MNILGLCLSRGKGGLESYAFKAISALNKAGHECHFAVSPNGAFREFERTIPSIEIQLLFPHLPVLAARKLADYIDTHQIDIIHMHWNKDLTLAAMSKWFSRRKPKLVYTRHMEITRSKKDFYHRVLYSQVDCLLANAQFVLEQAIRFLPMAMEKIKLLYLGVGTTPVVTPEQCKSLLLQSGENEDAYVIGMIGRIEHGKGQHVLIEAMDILQQQNLRPLVAMVGPIMDKTYYNRLIQQISEKNLTRCVKYLGVSSEPQKLMSCCDVVVLTTYCETFGLVLVEAMRVGTAVIGSNAGGVPEIIEHEKTGMLYEPGNASELADCLAELCRNKVKRENLARAGKEFADLMFDENRHFAHLAEILENL